MAQECGIATSAELSPYSADLLQQLRLNFSLDISKVTSRLTARHDTTDLLSSETSEYGTYIQRLVQWVHQAGDARLGRGDAREVKSMVALSFAPPMLERRQRFSRRGTHHSSLRSPLVGSLDTQSVSALHFILVRRRLHFSHQPGAGIVEVSTMSARGCDIPQVECSVRPDAPNTSRECRPMFHPEFAP